MSSPIALSLAPVTAFAVVVCSVPAVKRIAEYFDLSAESSSGAPSHQVPLLGGISLLLGFAVAFLLFGRGTFDYGAHPGWLLGGAGALLAVGLLDDIVVIQAGTKFVLQVIAIVPLVIWGPHFDFIPNRFLNLGFSVFWLLSTTNAFNFIDGVDGLAAGVGTIAALAIAAIAAPYHHATAVCALSLAGALGGFLIYNFSPASIFMGDAGALSVGLLLGILAIQGGHSAERATYEKVVIAGLVMMVPLLDTVTVTITRIATGKPISRRGLDHCHDRLATMGLSDRRIVAALCAVQLMAAASAVALSFAPQPVVVMSIPFLIVAFGIIGLFLADRTFELTAPGEMRDLPRIARIVLSMAYKRRFVEAALDLVVIVAAFFGALILTGRVDVQEPQFSRIIGAVPWVAGAGSLALFAAGIYRSVWKYAGIEDALRFALAAVLASVAVAAARFAALPLSAPVLALFGLLLFNLLAATRFSFRVLRHIIRRFANRPIYRVVVVGTGGAAEAAARHLTSDRGDPVRLLGYIDNDSFKWGKLIRGYPVLGPTMKLDNIFESTPFDAIVVAEENLGKVGKDAIGNFARRCQVAFSEFSAGFSDFDRNGVFAPGVQRVPARAQLVSALAGRNGHNTRDREDKPAVLNGSGTRGRAPQ